MGSKQRGKKRKKRPFPLISYVEFRKYEMYWNMKEQAFKNGFTLEKRARKTAYRIAACRATKVALKEWEERDLFLNQLIV